MIHSSFLITKAKNFSRKRNLLSAFSSTMSSTNINSALRILNLEQKLNYTPYDLRDAYFAAAKMCHPDSNKSGNDEDECTMKFLEVTEAYELLQNVARTGNREPGTAKAHNEKDDPFVIHKSDEENYRTACRESLGLDAETVEESKRCPLFREWLKGRTDAASHWNRFFMVNGGLAPMLNKRKIFKLSDGDDGNGEGIGTRRRKRRSNKR